MVNCTEENSLMEKDCAETDDNFTFSCFENDGGSYFDMDFNVNDSPQEASRKSEEFEFSVSVSSTDKFNITGHVDDVSPADDLFYKGQLLPLHLPPRLEMVKNLSLPNEHEGDTTGFDRYSSGSRDSNQEPGCFKESGCRAAENEDQKTHIQSTVKSANKLKVKVPIFGVSKFSKVDMDDFNYSPPMGMPLRFMVKLKSIKVASLPYLATDYSTEQSPDYPFNSNRTSTSAKHIVKKYVRLVKHRISSQRPKGAQTGDRQLKMEEGCVWPCIVGPCIAGPCIADESGRQTHVSFNHFDVDSYSPSMNSSPSSSTDDLQSAIDYCKQSNGVIGKKKLLA